jgi:hypothetical protein
LVGPSASEDRHIIQSSRLGLKLSDRDQRIPHFKYSHHLFQKLDWQSNTTLLVNSKPPHLPVIINSSNMLLSLIFPSEGSDLLSLCRIYSGVTAAAMITGHSMIGAATSAFAVYILQDNNLQPASRQDGQALESWLLLCSFSAVASVGSWALLFLSSLKDDESQAYQTYFFGYAIQKVWALFLVYIVLQDLRLKAGDSAEAESSSRARSGQRKSRRKRNSLASMVFYEFRIRVVAGKDLVPKDTNIFGKKISSDPYVIVQFGPNEIGRTSIIPKNLDPVWPKEFMRQAVLPKSLEIHKDIKFFIYDHDTMSTDDAMGTVTVPIPGKYDHKYSKWFDVKKGDGENFCHDARGQLLVEFEIVTT